MGQSTATAASRPSFRFGTNEATAAAAAVMMWWREVGPSAPVMIIALTTLQQHLETDAHQHRPQSTAAAAMVALLRCGTTARPASSTASLTPTPLRPRPLRASLFPHHPRLPPPPQHQQSGVVLLYCQICGRCAQSAIGGSASTVTPRGEEEAMPTATTTTTSRILNNSLILTTASGYTLLHLRLLRRLLLSRRLISAHSQRELAKVALLLPALLRPPPSPSPATTPRGSTATATR